MKHNFMFTLIFITLILVACGSPVPESESEESVPEIQVETYELAYSHSDTNGAYLNDKDGNIVFVDPIDFDFSNTQPDTLFIGTFEQHELTDLKLKKLEEN